MSLRVGAAIALLLGAAAMAGAEVQSPPLMSAPWSTLNPDMAGVVSTDRSAGASLVTFSGPMPAPTSDFVLRVASHLGGQHDYHGIVKDNTTWATLALDLCTQINADPAQRDANVSCQLSNPGTSTFFGVTHFNDNEMAVTPLTGEPLVQVMNGTLAWDAGPIHFLKRVPPGVVPPPGSNCGQYVMASVNSNFADTQYVTIGCTVDNSDASHVSGSFHLYTARTINGAPLLAERLVINDQGMFFDGRRVKLEGDQ